MPIPDFQSIMLPLLRYCRDGREHTPSETADAMAAEFKLSEDEKKVLLPSGVQGLFVNRVAWAKTYLRMAGLLGSSRRGVIMITPQGAEVLNKNPSAINMRFLNQFPEYVQWRPRKREKPELPGDSEINHQGTPEEAIENAHENLRQELAAELLEQIRACSPAFFERLVVEVIVKMGYGGTRQDAGKAIGRIGDGGIDGIIKEDKLGLDAIYIQAKRWENTVGRPEIQKFVGALTGQRAKKGLFISTSDFSAEAKDYVSGIEMKVVLIDGETLAQLMIDYNVGVSTIATYDLKKIDSDYFTEE